MWKGSCIYGRAADTLIYYLFIIIMIIIEIKYTKVRWRRGVWLDGEKKVCILQIQSFSDRMDHLF